VIDLKNPNLRKASLNFIYCPPANTRIPQMIQGHASGGRWEGGGGQRNTGPWVYGHITTSDMTSRFVMTFAQKLITIFSSTMQVQ
jgi:hypothetical protein